jgi:glycosyltransferase involved in cell wall biosynthesis
MRLLWVKMGGLWPATAGGRVRSLQMLRHLSQRHVVSVVTTHGPADDPEGLSRQLPASRVYSTAFVPPKQGSATFARALARSWFSPYPVDLWKWRVREMRDRVGGLLADGSFDLCVADFLFASVNVPSQSMTPVMLFQHNVEYLIWQRLAEIEQRTWKRAILEVEWRKLRRAEAAACARAHRTLAVSEEDCRRLSALAGDARTGAIPTGVDIEYFRPSKRPEIPGRLVFTGSMDWHPNEDAVIHFAESVLPQIRASRPDVTLAVVGRNPTPRLREAADRAGVIVTGTVDDVRPYIDEAQVYVVPLRAGSGTRLKIFEALAMARPVVSTTVGAEGLALTPDRNVVLADGPDDFARAVLALLDDPGRRSALGGAGRALVESRYSWAHVAREFEDHCEDVVAEHATGRRAHLSGRRADRPRGAGRLAGEHAAPGGRAGHP